MGGFAKHLALRTCKYLSISRHLLNQAHSGIKKQAACIPFSSDILNLSTAWLISLFHDPTCSCGRFWSLHTGAFLQETQQALSSRRCAFTEEQTVFQDRSIMLCWYTLLEHVSCGMIIGFKQGFHACRFVQLKFHIRIKMLNLKIDLHEQAYKKVTRLGKVCFKFCMQWMVHRLRSHVLINNTIKPKNLMKWACVHVPYFGVYPVS